MSEELPFEIPTDLDGIRKLYLETREMLETIWIGLPEDLMLQRPGPHPEWSVKDVIGHLNWWESFAISRLGVLAAGLEIKPIKDFDGLNKEVDAMVSTLSLEAVLAQFETNRHLILNLIDHFTFEEWADETRPNFEGMAFMFLLGANTFGHYHEHLAGLAAFREKHLS